MLKKVTSLIVAETVLNMVLNDDRFDPSKIDGYIESYQNGREQGLTIWILGNKNVKDHAYYICRYRRSDSICIYKGSYQFQSLPDDAYDNPKFFDYNDFQGAVDWLLKDMGMVD